MEQAGVYKIVLYENKGLEFVYYGGKFTDITNTGDILTINSDGCETGRIEFIQNPERNDNNKLQYLSEISYVLYDYSKANLQLLRSIKRSIYGWIAVLYFYDNNIRAIPTPFVFDQSRIGNESNSFAIELVNEIASAKPIDFFDPESGAGEWILKEGFWNDLGQWIDTEIWQTI